MGRHSSADQGHFYRSFLSWIGLWVLIAAVTGVAVWFVVAAIGGEQAQRPVAAETDSEPQTEPEPTVSGARVAKVEEPPETPEPAKTAAPKERNIKLVTDGVTVQVLNGTVRPDSAQVVAERLSGLGYSIVAVEESSRAYSETTVFWATAGSREAAVALADHFGWVAQPKPANLADTVSLHVVVGADEAPAN